MPATLTQWTVDTAVKRLYAARAPFVSWCSLLHDHIYVSQISSCASKVLVLAVIFLLYTDGLDVTWAAWCGSDVECVEKKKTYPPRDEKFNKGLWFYLSCA